MGGHYSKEETSFSAKEQHSEDSFEDYAKLPDIGISRELETLIRTLEKDSLIDNEHNLVPKIIPPESKESDTENTSKRSKNESGSGQTLDFTQKINTKSHKAKYREINIHQNNSKLSPQPINNDEENLKEKTLKLFSEIAENSTNKPANIPKKKRHKNKTKTQSSTSRKSSEISKIGSNDLAVQINTIQNNEISASEISENKVQPENKLEIEEIKNNKSEEISIAKSEPIINEDLSINSLSSQNYSYQQKSYYKNKYPVKYIKKNQSIKPKIEYENKHKNKPIIKYVKKVKKPEILLDFYSKLNSEINEVVQRSDAFMQEIKPVCQFLKSKIETISQKTFNSIFLQYFDNIKI